MALSAFLMHLLPLAAFSTDMSGPILFALHRGEIEKAFVNYLEFTKTESHDFALLQQAAKNLLEKGISSKDTQIQLMSIFGAGVAASSDLLPILEKGIKSTEVKTQVIALNYLGKQQDDEADEIILTALSSPFLITRLEALLLLSKRNHPAVLGHLDSLSSKVSENVRAVFAQIVVNLESDEAYRYLRKLLSDHNERVRVQTILTIAQAGRDDLIPSLRILSQEGSFAQQEAVAFALGKLKDYQSLGRLKELAESKQESVQLTAALGLYELGETHYLDKIETAARRGSLFAIATLGDLNEGCEILFQLLSHHERDVRLNAAVSLLHCRDSRALEAIENILVEQESDLGYWRISSAGEGLNAWKSLTSASQRSKNYPGIKEETQSFCEKILSQSIELDEKDFLKIAHVILEKQPKLIPSLVELLENKKSQAAIQLLKEGFQKAGAPLIRNYCTLALYRIKESGPYEELLIAWLKERGSIDLIQFRDETSTSLNKPHQLTPEEMSQFLVEVCQALATAQNPAGIEALLHAIAYGNPKNRYALAGLLLRTIE